MCGLSLLYPQGWFHLDYTPTGDGGAHARGFNEHSIGIAYEGGLDENGQPADTRTQRQKYSMRALIRTLKKDFSIEKVCGHRDLSPDANGNGVVDSNEWLKQCPCFDVATDEWCN